MVFELLVNSMLCSPNDKCQEDLTSIFESSFHNIFVLSDFTENNFLKMSKLKSISTKKSDNLDISKDDFESPVVFKKFKSSNENAVPKRTKPKRSCKKKQLTLHQVYQDNFKYSDMNSEHLQLALALSRSTTEMYNNCSTNEEFPLVTQKDGKKKTLLEFGFRTDKPKMNVENKIVRKEPTKMNKKSKYRFITPVLMMRTEEERESLIQSKLLSVFGQNSGFPTDYSNTVPEVSSEELEKVRCRECSKFFFSRTVESLHEEKFVVSHLNIEGTRAKSGSLLKDWKKIPLRDHTPERSKTENSDTIEDPLISEKNLEVSARLLTPGKDVVMPSIDSQEEVVHMNLKHSSNSQLSVDVRYGAVSPDLFDDFSLSEDRDSVEIEKIGNLKNEENSKEKKHFSNDNVEVSEYEHGEKRQDSLIHKKNNPEKLTLGEENKEISGHKQKNFPTNLKEEKQQSLNSERFLPDLHGGTVILSSDEELSILDNEFPRSLLQKNDSSLKEGEFNEDQVSFSLKNRSIGEHSDIYNSKSDKQYSLDYEEMNISLNNDEEEKTTTKDSEFEVVLSSDEEESERISDSLKLKELREKYKTHSNNTSADDSSEKKSQSYSGVAHSLGRKSSDSSSCSKSKKMEEDEKNSGFSSSLLMECDKVEEEIVVSSDDDVPNTKINEKFSDSFNELPMKNFEFSKYEKSIFSEKNSDLDNDKLNKKSSDDVSETKLYQTETDNCRLKKSRTFKFSKKPKCDSPEKKFDLDNVDIEESKNNFTDSLSDSLLHNVFENNFSYTKTKKEDSLELSKRKNLAQYEQQFDLENCYTEKSKKITSAYSINSPLDNVNDEHFFHTENTSFTPKNSDSFEFSNRKNYDSTKKQFDSDNFDIKETKNRFSNSSIDSLQDNVFEENFSYTKTNSSGSKKNDTKSSTRKNSALCEEQFDLKICNTEKPKKNTSDSSINCPLDNVFEEHFFHTENKSNRSEKYDTFELSNKKKSVSSDQQFDLDNFEIEKSRNKNWDSLSDSLLDDVFEENFSHTKNNSNESKKMESSRKSKKFCWGENYEVFNEAKHTDVSSSSSSIEKDDIVEIKSSNVKSITENVSFQNEGTNLTNSPFNASKKHSGTPLRRYTSFIDPATPKGVTNFAKHKSESNITPNNKFIVKTVDVTPMADYKAFSTPEIVQELGKFGLKPLKRKRGINLLEHIYETIHPRVEKQFTEIENVPKTKRKKCGDGQTKSEGVKDSYRMNIESETSKKWSGTISESEAIFERQRSSKIPTCQVPLQIVWHNFLNENPEILKNILLYEPLQVEVIHKMLKELGYKFHLQDLITFFDQKCITIRVAQNQHSKVG